MSRTVNYRVDKWMKWGGEGYGWWCHDYYDSLSTSLRAIREDKKWRKANNVDKKPKKYRIVRIVKTTEVVKIVK